MSCLELSITASKAISEPLELVVLSVIKLSTFESVKAVLSVFLITSSKAIVMSELTAIPVAESAGVKSRFGAVESAATKLISTPLDATSGISFNADTTTTFTVVSRNTNHTTFISANVYMLLLITPVLIRRSPM